MLFNLGFASASTLLLGHGDRGHAHGIDKDRWSVHPADHVCAQGLTATSRTLLFGWFFVHVGSRAGCVGPSSAVLCVFCAVLVVSVIVAVAMGSWFAVKDALQFDGVPLVLFCAGFSFLHVAYAFASLCAVADHRVEFLSEKVPSDEDHRYRYGRDVSDAHEEEEDCLLPSCARADVDGGQSGDGHCGHAYKEAVDEFDVYIFVGGVEDGRCDEGGEDEYDDVDALGEGERERACQRERGRARGEDGAFMADPSPTGSPVQQAALEEDTLT